jgi:hypothetical protein
MGQHTRTEEYLGLTNPKIKKTTLFWDKLTPDGLLAFWPTSLKNMANFKPTRQDRIFWKNIVTDQILLYFLSKFMQILWSSSLF